MLSPLLSHRELSVFSSSYAEAEQAFLGAVSALGLPARLTSLPYEGSGPSGESLATRQVWIGDQDAPRVLVLLSAVHGIEGFWSGSCTARSIPPFGVIRSSCHPYTEADQ